MIYLLILIYIGIGLLIAAHEQWIAKFPGDPQEDVAEYRKLGWIFWPFLWPLMLYVNLRK